MKIGIYGGTFNPPHLGHLTAAAAVIATLKLDKLLLIPASIPPHKDLPAGSATAEQRLEMTRMAGEQLGLGSKVETLDMEVRRAGKSFTSDTLAELKAQFPEDELWLLMGTDMFLSFETWHEPEKIASLAGIAAFGRTKADMEPQFSAQRDKLYRLYPDARIFTLTVPGVIDISSTELRERLASGTGENLLPPAVYGYILRNHLYGTDVNLKSLTLSQLRPENNQEPYTFGYGASTNISLPWSMTLSTNITNNARRGYRDASMNKNELIWNAQIAQNFLKGNAATISFEVYDILRQQSNISRSLTADMRSVSEYNGINSYCMLRFSYRLNVFGNKEARGNMRHGGFDGGGPRGPRGGFGGGRPH